MDDRRVQTRLHTLVQEHTVQQHAGRRVQPEGDVRQPQSGLHLRMAALQLTDALDRGHAVLAGLLLTRADRERQTVHEDVLLTDAPVPRQIRDQPLGDLDLLLRRPRLPLLVDRQRDQRRTVLPRQLRDLGEAGLGAVAVLVVHRVDHRAAAQHLQARPDHLHLGGVQHDRQRGRGREASGQLPHVRHTVPAHVVHAQVQQVGALADLLPRHLHAVVPAALQHRLTELPRPVGVGALTDRQVRGVLPERHTLIQRRRTRLRARLALHRRQLPHPLHQPPQMLRRGPAATAHQRQPVLPHERLLRIRQLRRGEGEVRAVSGQDGQAGVRHAHQGDTRLAGEMPQVFGHLPRARGAVEADHVDPERLQRGQGRTDLRAEQHGARRLEGEGADQRQPDSEGVHGTAGSYDGRLRLQQVLRRLHQQGVRAARDEPFGVAREAVPQRGVADVAEGGQLGARAHRTQHPARPAVPAGELVRRLAGDAGARLGQLEDPLGDVVLAQSGEVGAERVRLDAVDARVEVLGMHRTDDVGTGDVQDLVAALQLLEILEGRVLGLQHRAHGSVGHHHTGGQRLPQCGGPGGGGHRTSSRYGASSRAASAP